MDDNISLSRGVPAGQSGPLELAGQQLTRVDQRIAQDLWQQAVALTGNPELSLKEALQILSERAHPEMSAYLMLLSERVSDVALPLFQVLAGSQGSAPVQNQPVRAARAAELASIAKIERPKLEDIQEALARVIEIGDPERRQNLLGQLGVLVSERTDQTWQQTTLLAELKGPGSDELCFAVMDHQFRPEGPSPPHVYDLSKLDAIPENRRMHWLLCNAQRKPGQTAMGLRVITLPNPIKETMFTVARVLLENHEPTASFLDEINSGFTTAAMSLAEQQGQKGSYKGVLDEMHPEFCALEAEAGRCGYLLHNVGERWCDVKMSQEDLYRTCARAQSQLTGDTLDTASQEGRNKLLVQLAKEHLPLLLAKNRELELTKNVANLKELLVSGLEHTKAVFQAVADLGPLSDEDQLELINESLLLHATDTVREFSRLRRANPELRQQVLMQVIDSCPGELGSAVDRLGPASTEVTCRALVVAFETVCADWRNFEPIRPAESLRVLVEGLGQTQAPLANLCWAMARKRDPEYLTDEMFSAIQSFALEHDDLEAFCRSCEPAIKNLCAKHLPGLRADGAIQHALQLKNPEHRFNALRALVYMVGRLVASGAGEDEINWLNEKGYVDNCIQWGNQAARLVMIDAVCTHVSSEQERNSIGKLAAKSHVLPLAPLLVALNPAAQKLRNQLHKDLESLKGQRPAVTTSLLVALHLLNDNRALSAQQKQDLLVQVLKGAAPELPDRARALQTLLRGLDSSMLRGVDFKQVLIGDLLDNSVRKLLPLDPDRPIPALSARLSLKFPDPAPLIRYAAGLLRSNYDNAKQLLGEFVSATLLGSFPAQRYLSDENRHLEAVFRGRPQLAIDWRRNATANVAELDSDLADTGFTALDTDDPVRILTCGDVGGSCQGTDQAPSTNHCLANYMMDGKVRMLMIVDAEGNTAVRAVLRLLFDEEQNQPVLQLEGLYGDTSDVSTALIRQMALRRAQALNLPLVSNAHESDDDYGGTVSSLYSPGNEYVDAIGGVEGAEGSWSLEQPGLLWTPKQDH